MSIPTLYDPWIATYTGIKFRLLAATPAMVHWQDIVQGLTQTCRWTGQSTPFYSVAEHSCRVAVLVEREIRDPRAGLYALLHDAHEAYIGDFSAPLKQAMRRLSHPLDIVKQIAGPIDRAIYLAFGLDPVVPTDIAAAIHQADLVMLSTECRDLMPNSPPWDWQPPAPEEHRLLASRQAPFAREVLEANLRAACNELGWEPPCGADGRLCIGREVQTDLVPEVG